MWTLFAGTSITTKIGEFVSPPNFSETVTVSIMKLAHCPHIASTTIKLKLIILKPILLSSLSILLKKKNSAESALARSANRRRHLFVYGDSADFVVFRFVDKLVLPSRI